MSFGRPPSSQIRAAAASSAAGRSGIGSATTTASRIPSYNPSPLSSSSNSSSTGTRRSLDAGPTPAAPSFRRSRNEDNRTGAVIRSSSSTSSRPSSGAGVGIAAAKRAPSPAASSLRQPSVRVAPSSSLALDAYTVSSERKPLRKSGIASSSGSGTVASILSAATLAASPLVSSGAAGNTVPANAAFRRPIGSLGGMASLRTGEPVKAFAPVPVASVANGNATSYNHNHSTALQQQAVLNNGLKKVLVTRDSQDSPAPTFTTAAAPSLSRPISLSGMYLNDMHNPVVTTGNASAASAPSSSTHSRSSLGAQSSSMLYDAGLRSEVIHPGTSSSLQQSSPDVFRRGSFSAANSPFNPPQPAPGANVASNHAIHGSSISSSAQRQVEFERAMAASTEQKQSHAQYAYNPAVNSTPPKPTGNTAATSAYSTPSRHISPLTTPSSAGSSVHSPYSSTFSSSTASLQHQPAGALYGITPTMPASRVNYPSSSSLSSVNQQHALSTAEQRVANISNHFISAATPDALVRANAAAAQRGSLTLAVPSSTLLPNQLHSPSSASSASSSASNSYRDTAGTSSSQLRRNRTAASYGYVGDEMTDEEEDEENRHSSGAMILRRPNGINTTTTGVGQPSQSRTASLTRGLSTLSMQQQQQQAAPAQGSRMRALMGLGNMGNTCFLNSTLQCLLSTRPLLEYFSTGKYVSEINTKAARTKGTLAKAFGELCHKAVSVHDHAVERPAAVKNAVSIIDSKFSGYGQHDSHEFTRVLLSALHDDVNRIRVKPAYEEIKDGEHDSDAIKADRWWRNYCERNDSIVTDCFAGQLQSTLCCQTCKKTSQAFDPFMDLSLPIPKNNRASAARSSGSSGLSTSLSRMFSSHSSSSSSAVSNCSLSDCFREFVGEELLNGHEQVYCRNCKTHRDQTKKLRIYRWPRILVLHLKRFSYGGYSRAKISTDVEFPFELNCNAIIGTDGSIKLPMYDLYGVSNHMGSTGGGHYTSSCKVSDAESAPFFTFNDSHVSPMSNSAVKGPSAYVLFYRRRD